MKIRLLLLSLSLSLLALGAGAAPAYMDAKSSFPATPQGEAPLQQTYLQSSQDEAFLRLVKARNSKTLTPDLQTELLGELQNYQLADYAYAWNLLDAAKDAPDDPVLMEQAYEFLRTHQGEYIAERLGTDLARIVAKAGDAESFNRLYAPLQWNKTEPDIAAWHLAFGLQNGENKTDDALRLLQGGRLAKSSAAEKALTESLLAKSPESIWPVAAFLLQRRHLTTASALLNDYSGLDSETISSALHNPEQWLDATAQSPDNKQLRVLAALALIRSSTERASEKISQMQDTFEPAELALLHTFLGYRCAMAFDLEEANRNFRNARADQALPWLHQPIAVAEWRARSALSQKDWGNLQRTIAAMPEEKKSEDGWQYWLARALKEQGAPGKATEILRPLAQKHNYYAKLACDALGLAYPGDTLPEKRLTDEDLKQWMQHPAIIRAVLLRRLHLYSMAAREWNWALKDVSKPQLLGAAEYARRVGLTDRMINTSRRLPAPVFISELTFPTPSKDAILRIEQDSGIPAAWIYGITRQESRFMTTVTSGAGARGLMQLLPATARWTAKRYQLDTSADLNDPVANFTLGAFYLKYLDERFSGQKALATAGYNAGPGRPASWRNKFSEPIEGAIFAELIPFQETREYVKAVLNNTAEYQRILHPKKKRLTVTRLLGTVSPSY